ncbi:AdoMet-dependent rRNA methyltransferase spb1 [Steccherinum ochraceum]|uniref:AdoMet-dependent rRNA methyltransferase spb1 n=1 Tax=Steccherinum ochraceum TaxID=92696 RepID=A0A4R0RQD4_9APHY|nr:AdoMet-dependent rRNA methyltransferase spb1 [Steccherinum ochraceum]
MAKAQKKTGKGRLDKYYKLAKEQGYRARSAFKLIQLNKKYSFLESARCCIDLCAAPGGWLQVASKYMPTNSIIVGVDLVPIKPIPRVVTFASDITTTQCRNLIRGELKDWKADIVLHDGAPNVGSAWVQDAYSQSELVLMSMKLACDFLAKGGTFVTKVFRSADYNNLIWVFKQLFVKVEATKPPSSRNVSAEIFVVCQDFLAPKHIDPKFFDPKHVFKDLSATVTEGDKGQDTKNHQANVFQPEKKRRNRAGYDEGDYTLFKQAGAEEFIRSHDAIAFLSTYHKITFTTEEEKSWLLMDVTTSDIKANCEDLKVLGKGDFKALLRWRTSLREELGLEVKVKQTEELTETVEITEEVDPDEEIEAELERLNSEAAARQKRDRRRANEQKTKTIQRMQLQMTAPLDIGLEQADASLAFGQDDVFDLEHTTKALRKKGGISKLMDADDADSSDDEAEAGSEDEDEVLDEEEERDRKVAALEDELDGLYDAYQERMREKDAKYQAKKARNADAERGEWHGISKQDSDDEDEDDEDGGYEEMQAAKAKDDASSSDDDSSDDEDDKPVSKSKPASRKRRHEEPPTIRKKPRLSPQASSSAPAAPLSRAAEVWFSQDMFSGAGIDADDMEDSEESEEEVDEDEDEAMSEATLDDGDEDDVDDDDDFEIVPQDNDDDVEMWDVGDENEDEINEAKSQKHGLITPEAVTIAQQLVNRQKTRTELINEGFNRYSLNAKDGLPSWFLDDEGKHYKPNVPITKEAVAALRAKMRALDARPIKKVAEAKARKKMRAVQRLEKAMKKAEGVNETSDISERDKAKQIEKLMGKSMAKTKKKDIKVVVAKGAHKGLKGRPKGVKGRYLMVDARMRKEMRAQKRTEKANKKRKRT